MQLENRKAHISIAIDGPAGAGKSTISDMIAGKLGILHLDTGAMYRAAAFQAIREGVDTGDREAMRRLMDQIDLEVRFVDDRQVNLLDGKDVTDLLRTPVVSRGASDVAVHPEVRMKMVTLQREIAKRQSVVMDGRDIGTFVLPKATGKIYLTASVDERARRRQYQQKESGLSVQELEEIIREIRYRDHNDATREFAPLKQADDAILVDSTDLTPEEVVEKILNYLSDKAGDDDGTEAKKTGFRH